jgi:thymidylate kinase
VTDICDWAPGYRTIAIEGCDGVGKTTLAKRLAREHGFRIVHSGPTPAGHDLRSRYRRILMEPGSVVLDRCFVSELVYGPLFREGSRLTSADVADLCQVLAERDGALLYVTASTGTVLERLGERGEPMPAGTVSAIQQAYDDVVAELEERLTIVRYSTDVPR